jgi:hypothetical protein
VGVPKPASAHFDVHVGPHGTQPRHQILQVVLGAEPRRYRARPQTDQDDLIGVGRRDDQRQILPLAVVAVEHDEWLLAVRRLVHRVAVAAEPARRRSERRDEVIDQRVTQAPERRNRDGVLEARERGLAGQVVGVRTAPRDDLEHWIAAQRVVIVLVLVAGDDAVQPRPKHFRALMPDQLGGACILQRVDEPPGKPDPLIKLAERQQASVTGKSGLARLDDQRRGGKKIEHPLPSTLYTHDRPPCESSGALPTTPSMRQEALLFSDV